MHPHFYWSTIFNNYTNSPSFVIVNRQDNSYEHEWINYLRIMSRYISELMFFLFHSLADILLNYSHPFTCLPHFSRSLLISRKVEECQCVVKQRNTITMEFWRVQNIQLSARISSNMQRRHVKIVAIVQIFVQR